MNTEKKIIRSLSEPFSDIPVLTGIVDQIPFESTSKSKDKNYYNPWHFIPILTVGIISIAGICVKFPVIYHSRDW